MTVIAQSDQQTPLQNDDNEIVHQNKKKNELQSIKNDAMGLAMLSLYRDKKIRALMEEDRYWVYVMKHDEAYSDRVVAEAIKVKKEFKANPRKYLPLVPPKKDQGGAGGAGGGAPPAMGSSDQRVIVADVAGKMYLYRKDGEYRLRDTLAGKILAGKFPLYIPSGSCFKISLTPDENGVVVSPRHGNVAKLLDRLERDLLRTMTSALTQGLSDLGIDSAAEIASSLVSECNQTQQATALHLYKILPNLTKPSFVILLETVGSNAKEPNEINDLRVKIGQALDPFTEELNQALRLDGIEFTSIMLPDGDKNPKRIEKLERDIKRSKEINENSILESIKHATPQLLNISKIKGTKLGRYDMKSLIMTVMGTNDAETTDEAIQSIIYLMKHHYSIYNIRPLTDAEVQRISNKINSEFPQLVRTALILKTLVVAANGDDAKFMETLSIARDRITGVPSSVNYSLGQIAQQQGRDDIINADPALALDNESEYLINPNIISRLSVSDPTSADVILKAWDWQNDPENGLAIDNRLLAKMSELAATGNKKAIMALSKDGSVKANFLRAALAFENNMIDVPGGIDGSKLSSYIDELYALQDHEAGSEQSTLNEYGEACSGLIALSILENKPDSPVLQSLRIKPSNIFSMKPKVAESYMQKTRVDLNGNKIPSANEIHSLPENPLSLVKSLFLLKDEAGLLVSLQLIAEKMVAIPNDKVEYALEYTMSALRDLGRAQEADYILKANKLVVDSNGIRRILTPTMVPRASIDKRHVLDCFNTGDMVSAARFTNLLFKGNPTVVLDILNSLQPNDIFAKLLDPAVKNYQGVPEWIVGKPDIEASMLPNGVIVVGKSGIYEVYDGMTRHCFACSKSDSLSIAWEKIQG